MLCSHNPNLESRNFVDGVDFTKDDPCIFVVYPGGAAGDLLISIIDKHYLRTGCEYYGINDNGRVMLYTTDYELIDIELETTGAVSFNQQWFYNLGSKLGERNLNYSLLDQVIFGCHLHSSENIQRILDTFSKAKIINIYAKDAIANDIITKMRISKTKNTKELVNKNDFNNPDLVLHGRVLNIPFGCLFNENLYSEYYTKILNFLELPGKLISFDYVKYYLSKQNPETKNMLLTYSDSFCESN
jgi:hypothetical protein